MLQKIRKTADSVIFRIFLGLIVVTFAIWGVSDVAKGRGNSEIVTFDDITPITYEDFATAKAKEIKNIQRSEGISLSDKELDEMNMDQHIVSMLVGQKMLTHLAFKYDLDFSDSVIAEVVKTLPLFQNDQGAFNIEKFKSFLQINGISTEEYSDEIKNHITRTIILGSFVGNAYIPNVRLSNIIDHMSEKRVIDIASMPLSSDKKNEKLDVAEDRLRNFYEENKDAFKTMETRDICYAKLDNNIAKHHISINDHEIKQYFDENKAEFSNKKLDKVRSEIKRKLQEQKSESWIAETSKSLIDEVAGGSSLSEIADKYKLTRLCEKNINQQNVASKAGGVLVNFTSQIYEMSENEVSYPLDGGSGSVVLLEVVKHVPEVIQEFEAVKSSVVEKYKSFAYRQDALKKLQDLATHVDNASFNKDAASLGMRMDIGRQIRRSELAEMANLPSEMLVAMFSTEAGVVIGPFVGDNNAYIFVVRKIFYDKDAKQKIEGAKNNIVMKIKEGLMEELLLYSRRHSNMKTKMNPKSLEKPNRDMD